MSGVSLAVVGELLGHMISPVLLRLRSRVPL